MIIPITYRRWRQQKTSHVEEKEGVGIRRRRRRPKEWSRRNRERWPVIFLRRQDNERWWHTDEKDEEHLALAHSFSSEVYNNNSPSPPVAARAFLYPKNKIRKRKKFSGWNTSQKREWGPPQKSSLKQLFTIKSTFSMIFSFFHLTGRRERKKIQQLGHLTRCTTISFQKCQDECELRKVVRGPTTPSFFFHDLI